MLYYILASHSRRALLTVVGCCFFLFLGSLFLGSLLFFLFLGALLFLNLFFHIGSHFYVAPAPRYEVVCAVLNKVPAGKHKGADQRKTSPLSGRSIPGNFNGGPSTVECALWRNFDLKQI